MSLGCWQLTRTTWQICGTQVAIAARNRVLGEYPGHQSQRKRGLDDARHVEKSARKRV